MADKLFTRDEMITRIRAANPGFVNLPGEEVWERATRDPFEKARLEERIFTGPPAPPPEPPSRFTQMKDLAGAALRRMGQAAAPAVRNVGIAARSILPPATLEEARQFPGKTAETAFKLDEALNLRPMIEKKVTVPIMRAIAPVGLELAGREIAPEDQDIIGRTALETLNQLVPMSPSEAAGWLIGPKATEAGVKVGLLGLAKVAPQAALKLVSPITGFGDVDALFSGVKQAVERKAGFRIPDKNWGPIKDDMARAILKNKIGVPLKRTAVKEKAPAPNEPVEGAALLETTVKPAVEPVRATKPPVVKPRLWELPLERVQEISLEKNLQPPGWLSPERIAADMKAFPNGEWFKKWAAEEEIVNRGTRHRVTSEDVQKYGLEEDVEGAIDEELLNKREAVEQYITQRHGTRPFWNLAKRVGYFSKAKVMKSLGIEKGREFPEELAPLVRKNGEMDIGGFAQEAAQAGLIPENSEELAIEGLLQDWRIMQAQKEGKDISTAIPQMRGYSISAEPRGKGPGGDLPGQTFIPGTGPQMPNKKIMPAGGVDQEAFEAGFRAEPEQGPGLFEGQFKAAVRDPGTGKIYTGESHAEAAASVPEGDTEAARRVLKELTGRTANTGFVGPDGVFITRAQAKKKYGFETSEGMRGKRGGASEALEAGKFGVSMPLESVKPLKRVYKAVINKFAETAFKTPIAGRATIRMGEAVGRYFPKNGIIRLKTWGDLEVLAHEIAHAIDDKIFGNKLRSNFSESAIIELKRLDYDTKARRIKEGFAEWFRYYMTMPEKAEELAPAVTHEFERRWKGTPLLDNAKTLQGMFQDWYGQGALERGKAQTDFMGETAAKETIPEKTRASGREFYRQWVDRFDNFKVIEEEGGIQPGPKLTPFELLTKFSNKASAIAEHWVMTAAVDLDGNVIGPSLKEALSPAVMITPRGFVDKEQWENFVQYAIAKRGLELEKRGIEPGRDVADMKFIVDKFKSAEWDQAVDNWVKWQHNLNSLLLGPVYSAKEIRAIEDSGAFYIPFARAGVEPLSSGGGGKGLMKHGQAVYRIKGSGRPIINPIESSVTAAHKFIDIAIKARIAQSLGEWADLTPKVYGKYIWPVPPPMKAVTFTAAKLKDFLESEGIPLEDLDLEKMVRIFQVAGAGRGNVLPIVIGGKRGFYEIDPKIYEALNEIGIPKMGPLITLLRPFAILQRMGATGLNAAFALLRNPLKDWQTFAAFNQYTKNPAKMTWDLIKGTARGAAPMAPEWTGIKADELTKRWLASGGNMATFFGSDRQTAYKVYDELLLESGGFGSKALLVAKHPIRSIQALLSLSERGPRLAELQGVYEKLKAEHPDWPESVVYNRAFNAAQDVTVNFSRGGYLSRQVNQASAFFGASTQGPDKLAREAKRNPAGLVLRGLAYLTPAAVYYWWQNKDKEWYSNLPYSYRYNNIFVETEGAIVRIPLPFEVGLMFQTLPVAMLDYMYRKDPESVKGLGQSAAAQFPNPIPSAFGPLIDVARDKNYMGAPIEGKKLKNYPVSERINPETMPLATAFAHGLEAAGLEVSPVQMDYLLNNYLGGWPRRTGVTGGNIREPADWPVLGGVIVRQPERPARQLNVFFTEMKRLRELSAADKISDRERGKLGQMEIIYDEVIKYAEDDIRKQRAAGNMEKVRADYAKISKALELIKP